MPGLENAWCVHILTTHTVFINTSLYAGNGIWFLCVHTVYACGPFEESTVGKGHAVTWSRLTPLCDNYLFAVSAAITLKQQKHIYLPVRLNDKLLELVSVEDVLIMLSFLSLFYTLSLHLLLPFFEWRHTLLLCFLLLKTTHI